MSSAGTNGTDLTTTLTTQGDLVYRDGSGLQRLGAGTAGQVLQTGGAGANPSWSDVGGGVLQVKQWRKLSTINNTATSDSVLASPFDGTATITPSVAGNFVKVDYHVAIDMGTTWRSGHVKLEWSSDGGTTYYGLAGGSMSAFSSSNAMQGNSISLVGMFNPNTTNAVKVRVVCNGHTAGQPNRYGQYNNEGEDNTNTTPDTTNGVVAVGHAIILTELDSGVCSTTDVA
jgi:hypothetical protein